MHRHFSHVPFLPQVDSVPERGPVSCLLSHLFKSPKMQFPNTWMNKEILKSLQLCPAQKDRRSEEGRNGPSGSRKGSTVSPWTRPMTRKAEHLCFSISNQGAGCHPGRGDAGWGPDLRSAIPQHNTVGMPLSHPSFPPRYWFLVEQQMLPGCYKDGAQHDQRLLSGQPGSEGCSASGKAQGQP